MCGVCGCADPANEVSMTDSQTGVKVLLRDDHAHDHGHDHDHAHSHDDHHHGHDEPHVHGPGGEIISLETAILGKNNEIATRNRGWFEGRGVIGPAL